MTEAGLDLRTATVESFEPYIGQEFEVSVEENGEPFTKFILEEATAVGKQPEGFRQPFSLLFGGPGDLPLDQQLLWFSNPGCGALGIFIVPISGNAEKRKYQAVFN